MKKKLLILGVTGVVVLAGAGVGAYAYGEANAFELKSDKVSIELGDALNENVADYINGGKKALAGATLDFSKVDTANVGTYTAYANYNDKELSFTVEVEDTTAPDVKFENNGEFQIVAGGTLSGNDVVADMSDLSGIASVTFSDAVTVNKEEKDLLSAITLSYDTEGTYSNTAIITDNNGNATEKEISIHVVEDYAKHVSGFHDWTVEQDADIDFTHGIDADERIASVKAGNVDLSKTGEYTLVYSITGDDNETVIEHSVTVTVVDASKAQTMANNGETVYVSGNGTKAKEVKNVASSTGTNKNSSSSSNKSSSASGSKSGSSSSNKSGSTSSNKSGSSNDSDSSESHFYDSWEEGTTIDMGEPIGAKQYEDGTIGYAYEDIIMDDNGNIMK